MTETVSFVKSVLILFSASLWQQRPDSDHFTEK